MRTFKVRFVKKKDSYTLQIKNFWGIWRTQMEKACADAGCIYIPCSNKDKEVLLNFVILNHYWTKRHYKIIEYPTLEVKFVMK